MLSQGNTLANVYMGMSLVVDHDLFCILNVILTISMRPNSYCCLQHNDFYYQS